MVTDIIVAEITTNVNVFYPYACRFSLLQLHFQYMNPLEALRERRERKINDRVQEAACSTAAAVFDSLLEREIDPYKIRIGEKPRGIQTDEYMSRVSGRALEILSQRGLDDMVEYDPVKSERASLEGRVQGSALVADLDRRNLQLVFKNS